MNTAASKPVVPAFEPDLGTTDLEVLKEQVKRLMAGRHYSAAASCFRRMTELDPQNAQFYNDLATAEAMGEMLPTARAAQAKAIELAPDVLKYKINMSKIMMMQKDYYSARELIESVIPLAEGRRIDELANLRAICTEALVDIFGPDYSSTDEPAPQSSEQYSSAAVTDSPFQGFWPPSDHHSA